MFAVSRALRWVHGSEVNEDRLCLQITQRVGNMGFTSRVRKGRLRWGVGSGITCLGSGFRRSGMEVTVS